MTSRPAMPFSSSGRAAGDGPAVVDDRDVVGQLVGLVEVLGGEQHVGAGRARARGSPATARCGCGDRGRWSARRAAAGGVRRRGWRRGRAGGACRPSSRGPGGRPRPRGRAGRAPRPPRPGPHRRPWPNRRATMTRFSRPVMAGSTAANWPASPITPRTRSGCRAASMPATRRRPASGRSSVATARTRVDLPAPFGPSTAVTWPDGATRSSPSSASTWGLPDPKRLGEPLGLDGGAACLSLTWSWRHHPPGSGHPLSSFGAMIAACVPTASWPPSCSSSPGGG